MLLLFISDIQVFTYIHQTFKSLSKLKTIALTNQF